VKYDCVVTRAGLKGKGGRGNFYRSPYDVIHEVIVCKSYVFAYWQGSRFFPVDENVLNQMHIQLAAIEFMI